jgi:NifU-like protein involved in Fe-S cluster formation
VNAYSDAVRDHFENPRNAGEILDADAVGYETNPVCGDTMRLTLRINGGRIVEARFQASGCPAAMAASSVCTEMVRGLSLAEAEAVTKEQYAAALGGLPPGKMHCSVLAADAVRAAAADYRRRESG